MQFSAIAVTALTLATSLSLCQSEEILLEARTGFELKAALTGKTEGTKLGIALDSGRYFISEAIEIEGVSSIGLRAKEGARPVISGGRKIREWTNLGANRWRAKLPDVAAGKWHFRELYIGGKRATRARHPDSGTLRIAAAGEDRRTAFRSNPGDLQNWTNPGSIEFVFYHDWSLSRVLLENIDLKQNFATLADPIGQTTAAHYAMDHFEKQPRYHLENHPDFLTAAGEWHLDDRSGELTYLAHPGEDPNQLEVIAPCADALLRISQCKHIDFDGITFAHANWQLPPGGCAGVQAAFHQVRPAHGVYENRREAKPAAIELSDCSDITFNNCHFEGLTASGLWVRNGCKNITIENSTFREIGANAVMVGDQAASEETASSHVSIDGCTIEDCGTTDYGAVGIWIGIANHVSVKNNTLQRLPYTGVSVGWRWNPTPSACHHNLIEDNHIHHIMQKLSDGGGIYTLGRQPGTILRRNRIHDVPVNAGRAESNGMFLDEGTTDILIENNTIYRIARSPLRFHRAGENLVKSNTLYRWSEDIPMVRYNNTPEKNITLEANQAPVGDGP